jgi:hypothetical protein
MILQWVIIIFFLLLPFHSFGVTFLNDIFFTSESISPLLLAGWKEIFLIIFFVFSGFFLLNIIYRKKIELDNIDVFIILFSLSGLIISLWKGQNLLQVLLGIKYDFFFIWIFFCFKHLNFKNIFLNKIINYLIFIGLFIILFGFFQKFINPNILLEFGYFNDPSVDTTEKPASFCQLLENTNTCRIQSFFAGPIRLAGFLVFLSGLLYIIFLRKKNIYILSIQIPILLLLFWTYSRSGWIAELILIISTVLLYKKSNFLSFKQISIFISILLTILLSLYFVLDFKNVILREGSTNKHIEGFIKSIENIKTIPSGIGLGTAGAASTYFDKEKILLNENWYLQVFTELGVFGGIIFLLLNISILYRLHKNNSPFLPLFLALSIMACFTHLWEESATAYIFWAILGINLNKINNKLIN